MSDSKNPFTKTGIIHAYLMSHQEQYATLLDQCMFPDGMPCQYLLKDIAEVAYMYYAGFKTDPLTMEEYHSLDHIRDFCVVIQDLAYCKLTPELDNVVYEICHDFLQQATQQHPKQFLKTFGRRGQCLMAKLWEVYDTAEIDPELVKG